MYGFLPKEEFNRFLLQLRRCTGLRALLQAKEIHAEIIKSGCSGNRVLGNHLVQMYGSCGSLPDARLAFAHIHSRNEFSWNILISAHTHSGHLDLAREIFERMPLRDVVSFNTVTAAFVQAGRVSEAGLFFAMSPERDDVSWNVMITAYAERGHLDLAKDALRKAPMHHLVSCTGIISAFLSYGEFQKAQELFNELPRLDTVAWTVMFNAYAQYGHLQQAREIFDGMENKDTTSWTTMITAYCNSNNVFEAKSLFDRVPEPDSATFNAMISGYTQANRVDEARELFDAMPAPNVISRTCMLSCYARLGDLTQAKRMFDEMPDHDVVAWNAMISAYGYARLYREALDVFKEMVLDGVQPLAETFISVVHACANIPAVLQGKLIHAEITEAGLSFSDSIELQNALITMHGRFGNVRQARGVFDEMTARNPISWSAVIAAYGQGGETLEALVLFKQMILEGMEPDGVTYMTVLGACSHSGLVDEGVKVFFSIMLDYSLEPEAEHFVCFVDLLARAGQIHLAEEVLKGMPYEANALAWTCIAAACRDSGDAQVAELALNYAMEHEPERTLACYTLRSQSCRHC